jgi:hypothetical protein
MVDVSRMPFLFQARQTDGICKPGRVSVSVAARRQYVGAGGLWRHESPQDEQSLVAIPGRICPVCIYVPPSIYF